MSLATLLAKYEGVRLANAADNTRILRFFDSHDMGIKKISLQYERGPDYFALVRARSTRSLTFVYENTEGEIKGIASISYRDGYVDGKLETVGYLGDLRIAIDRHIIRQWKKLYAEIVSTSPTLEETGRAKHYLTALVDENSLARRTLVRSSFGGLAYNPLVPYRMVNIFRPRPWAKAKPLKKYSVEVMRAKDVKKVQEFLNRENSGRYFGEHNELLRRLEAWPQFTPESCVVVRDNGGNLRGFCGYWDNSMLKRTRIFYHSRQFNFMSHALSLPKDGDELRFMYMTNFCVDYSLPRKEREKIASALFSEGYRRFKSSQCHFLSFCEFSNSRWRSAIKQYFFFTTPMSLYTVTGTPEIVTIPPRPPGFEMAIV